MVLKLVTKVLCKISLLLGNTDAFTNRKFSKLFDVSQDSEADNSDEFIVNGQVTDQAIDFGKVVSPTYIFLDFESRETGGGASTDGTLSPVTIKVNGSTSQTGDTYLQTTKIPLTDTLPTNITFTTLVDTNTILTQVIVGRIA